MISVLKTTVEFLTSPMNLISIGVLASFLLKNTHPKLAGKCLFFSLVWLFLTGTRFLPDILVYQLEKQHDVLQPDNSVYGLPIIVLGGGSTNDLDIPAQEQLSHPSLARLTEGIRLYWAIDPAFIVFSGHSSKGHTSQAKITKLAAIDLGIPENKIRILEEPTTTEEEAMEYKNVFGNKYPDIVVVTSDIHMPRATYLFRKHGLNPIPAPSDHILKVCHSDKNKYAGKFSNFIQLFWSLQSGAGNFQKFSAAMHEYIGLLWARFN